MNMKLTNESEALKIYSLGEFYFATNPKRTKRRGVKKALRYTLR